MQRALFYSRAGARSGFCRPRPVEWRAPPARFEGRRAALVIGNGAYSSSPLRNPPNDARDMAKALGALGFQVSLGVDLDQKEMKRSIEDFGLAIAGADIALFYYSGHGVQIGKDNYLIPVGASISISSSGDVEYEAVELGRVLAKMEDAKARTNVLILDACRDNPLPAAARGGSRGLTAVERKPPESIIVYAAEAGETAADGDGRNGTFTESLLRNISRADDFASLLLDVKAEVRNATGNKQRPAAYENLTHKIYLGGSLPGKEENQGIARSDKGRVELEAPSGATIAIAPAPGSSAAAIEATSGARSSYRTGAGGKATIADLPAGSYSLVASGPGLETAREDFTLARGAVHRFVPWTTGTLLVETDPPGVDVQVDGRAIGKSPARLEVQAPGSLRVMAPESVVYQSAERNCSVEHGRTTSVVIVLKVKPSSLSVTVPEGASVSIEG